MKKITKRYMLYISLGLMVMILAISGVTYAYFMRFAAQDSTNIISTLNCVDVAFNSNTDSIDIAAAYPLTNAEGLSSTPYNFTIKNNCNTYVEYQLIASVVTKSNNVPIHYVKISLDGHAQRSPITLSNLPILEQVPLELSTGMSSHHILTDGFFDGEQEHTYDYRMWLDGENNAIWTDDTLREQGLQIRLSIIGIARTKPIMPIDLASGMIPVAYDNDGNTIKANSSNNNDNWYNYEEFKWANAVLVTDASRNNYQTANPGTIINEDDILAYYVWIPRFSYTLFNVNNNGDEWGTEQQINVTFQTKNDPKHNGTQNGQELTHPAFTFGNDELNGFWVGKFILTGTAANPTVKPNVTMLRDLNVSSLWTTIKRFETDAQYGINNTNMNSHMMKNMEWGAVAYLSNSQYGQRNNPIKATREVFINPSNGFITGRSGNTAGQASATDTSGAASSTLWSWTGHSCSTKTLFECTGTKQETFGMAASTTGNQYGIYDMSGGALEYVMGNMASSNTNFTNHVMNVQSVGTSFGSYTDITLPKRYYDIYDFGTTNNNASAYRRGQLGDATREIVMSIDRSWTSAVAFFPSSTNGWFLRGGDHYDGSDAGAWSFNGDYGLANSFVSARSVLAYIP